MAPSGSRPGASLRRRIGLFLGPAALAAVWLLPPPANLSPAGWHTAGLAGLMAVWWISEAIPIPATALLPLAVLPLAGVGTMRQTAEPYANPIIFLFLGGFILAAGLEATGLHRRVALGIIRLAGTTPRRIIGGFMAASAFLSMWVSNTATVMMMLPIAMSTLLIVEPDTESPDPNFAIALLLGVAYAANIGGLATLIGTPPNALLAGFMEETYRVTLGFAQWMTLGLPLVLVAVPLAWLLLSRLLFPVENRAASGTGDRLAAEWRRRGTMSRREGIVAGVAGGTALAWIFRPVLSGWLPGLSDPGIAIAGALLLFLIPTDWKRWEPILTWKSVDNLPWGILILFGGGISLASAIQRSGLAEWIGAGLTAAGTWPLMGMVAAVTSVIVLLTEITSNTATAATFLPVVAALAVASGVDPLLLAAPAALAASCAFMLPVATPPNAIVYASERIPIMAMIRAGVVLNLVMLLLITIMSVGILSLW